MLSCPTPLQWTGTPTIPAGAQSPFSLMFWWLMFFKTLNGSLYTVVSRNHFPSNSPVRKCSTLNGGVQEELGAGWYHHNYFQAFLIFPSNLGHNDAQVWKSAEFCKRLNHTNFSVQPFHLWRKAMSKTQRHYDVCISKINLFTCKTDTLKSKQPIQIISYNVGTWFA